VENLKETPDVIIEIKRFSRKTLNKTHLHMHIYNYNPDGSKIIRIMAFKIILISVSTSQIILCRGPVSVSGLDGTTEN
jgi:hypothetical protein